MKKPHITTVLFDLGGVVVPMAAPHLNKNIKSFFQITEFSFLEQEHALDLFETGAVDEKGFWELVAKNIHKSLPQNWHSIFQNSTKWTNMRPTFSKIIAQLKNQNITTATLSNASEPFIKRFRRLGYLKHFDYIFHSHIIGFRKPDPRIYQHVLKTLKKQPEEVLFIDDNRSYIEGAKKFGIHTITFRSVLQMKREMSKFVNLI